MFKLIRLALLGVLVVAIPTVGKGRCPESNEIMCGMECTGGIGVNYCALVVTPNGQTSETMACMQMSGGCITHDNDCQCGGSGTF